MQIQHNLVKHDMTVSKHRIHWIVTLHSSVLQPGHMGLIIQLQELLGTFLNPQCIKAMAIYKASTVLPMGLHSSLT